MNDFGPLPTEHPRAATLRKAELELGEWLLNWREFWELTRAEYLAALAQAITDDARSAIVTERRNAKSE